MIHGVCRSKTLISSFNHFGLVTSYDELLRDHNDLASYVIVSSARSVPHPSHFDATLMTSGAFDNFDHEEGTMSGIGGSHDTVSILVQDKSVDPPSKPHISEANVEHGSK